MSQEQLIINAVRALETTLSEGAADIRRGLETHAKTMGEDKIMHQVVEAAFERYNLTHVNKTPIDRKKTRKNLSNRRKKLTKLLVEQKRNAPEDQRDASNALAQALMSKFEHGMLDNRGRWSELEKPSLRVENMLSDWKFQLDKTRFLGLTCTYINSLYDLYKQDGDQPVEYYVSESQGYRVYKLKHDDEALCYDIVLLKRYIDDPDALQEIGIPRNPVAMEAYGYFTATELDDIEKSYEGYSQLVKVLEDLTVEEKNEMLPYLNEIVPSSPIRAWYQGGLNWIRWTSAKLTPLRLLNRTICFVMTLRMVNGTEGTVLLLLKYMVDIIEIMQSLAKVIDPSYVKGVIGLSAAALSFWKGWNVLSYIEGWETLGSIATAGALGVGLGLGLDKFVMGLASEFMKAVAAAFLKEQTISDIKSFLSNHGDKLLRLGTAVLGYTKGDEDQMMLMIRLLPVAQSLVTRIGGSELLPKLLVSGITFATVGGVSSLLPLVEYIPRIWCELMRLLIHGIQKLPWVGERLGKVGQRTIMCTEEGIYKWRMGFKTSVNFAHSINYALSILVNLNVILVNLNVPHTRAWYGDHDAYYANMIPLVLCQETKDAIAKEKKQEEERRRQEEDERRRLDREFFEAVTPPISLGDDDDDNDNTETPTSTTQTETPTSNTTQTSTTDDWRADFVRNYDPNKMFVYHTNDEGRRIKLNNHVVLQDLLRSQPKYWNNLRPEVTSDPRFFDIVNKPDLLENMPKDIRLSPTGDQLTEFMKVLDIKRRRQERKEATAARRRRRDAARKEKEDREFFEAVTPPDDPDDLPMTMLPVPGEDGFEPNKAWLQRQENIDKILSKFGKGGQMTTDEARSVLVREGVDESDANRLLDEVQRAYYNKKSEALGNEAVRELEDAEWALQDIVFKERTGQLSDVERDQKQQLQETINRIDPKEQWRMFDTTLTPAEAKPTVPVPTSPQRTYMEMYNKYRPAGKSPRREVQEVLEEDDDEEIVIDAPPVLNVRRTREEVQAEQDERLQPYEKELEENPFKYSKRQLVDLNQADDMNAIFKLVDEKRMPYAESYMRTLKAENPSANTADLADKVRKDLGITWTFGGQDHLEAQPAASATPWYNVFTRNVSQKQIDDERIRKLQRWGII